jgi:hypothetical protein
MFVATTPFAGRISPRTRRLVHRDHDRPNPGDALKLAKWEIRDVHQEMMQLSLQIVVRGRWLGDRPRFMPHGMASSNKHAPAQRDRLSQPRG